MKFTPRYPISRIVYLLWSTVLLISMSAAEGPTSHISICVIQGSSASSKYAGRPVKIDGVVTLDYDDAGQKGFYMQAENCDDDAETSDGIFVYLGEKVDIVSPGDYISVRGWVVEFFGLTEVSVKPDNVELLGQRPLPVPVNFSPPLELEQSERYFESHEGMRVATSSVVVVGPTTARGEVFVIDSGWSVDRIYRDMQTGAIIKIGTLGVFDVEQQVRVGDTINGIVGVLDYQRDEFQVQLTSPVDVQSGAVSDPKTVGTERDFSFATVNLHNLFDTFNDPEKSDPIPSSSAYRRKLEKLARLIADDLGLPSFIAVQEAENGDVLQALLNRPEIPVRYGYVWFDGPDQRGIDTALLYRTDRVEILHSYSSQGCTDLIDGLGPDGNLNTDFPQNAVTCDLDGLRGNEGNRLFSRPPLVVQLAVCEVECEEEGERKEYWVVTFHLKSKSQDTPEMAYTVPRRMEQAAYIADLYAQLQRVSPEAKVILLGDFNDYPDSAPADLLIQKGLVNLMKRHPNRLYTYNYKGVSQVLDHVFVSPGLFRNGDEYLLATPLHIAADYPAGLENDPTTSLRASDHDPVLVWPVVLSHSYYFPLVSIGKNSP